mgnify:CR=1 FL=1
MVGAEKAKPVADDDNAYLVPKNNGAVVEVVDEQAQYHMASAAPLDDDREQLYHFAAAGDDQGLYHMASARAVEGEGLGFYDNLKTKAPAGGYDDNPEQEKLDPSGIFRGFADKDGDPDGIYTAMPEEEDSASGAGSYIHVEASDGPAAEVSLFLK